MRQFEDVLFSVDDLEAVGLRMEFGNVSSFEPSILSDGLSGHIRLFVVAHEDLRTSQPDLSSRTGLSLLVHVLGGVLHLGDIC